MPGPKYRVRVFTRDLPKGTELLAGIEDSPFFGNEISPDFPEKVDMPENLVQRSWNPAAATAEIWSGKDAALAKLLAGCFFESRIPYRRQGLAPGELRYFVLPSHECAARAIISDAPDATPPGCTARS